MTSVVDLITRQRCHSEPQTILQYAPVPQRINLTLVAARVLTPEGHRHNVLSATEVYRITNETSQDKYFGSKFRVERIFGDNGCVLAA
jgi:hypothetical protein